MWRASMVFGRMIVWVVGIEQRIGYVASVVAEATCCSDVDPFFM